MKNHPATLALLTLGLAAAPASAALLVSESFTYTPGAFAGSNGGTGWNSAWSLNASHDSKFTVVDPATNLSYAVSGGGTINGGDSALQISGTANADNLGARTFDAYSGDNLYISFLYSWSGGTVAASDTLLLKFSDTWSTVSTPNFGVFGGTGGDFVGRFGTGASNNRNTEIGAGEIGDTFLVVAQLSKSVSGAASNYDRLSLWINPASDSAPFGTVSGTFTSSVSAVGFRGVTLDADDVILIDELKVGTTWADVVPVPEPSAAAALAGFAAIGLAATRRRRR